MVTVNGTSATLSSGIFYASNISLITGENMISAIAVDPSNNSSESTVTITFEPLPIPPDPATVAPPLDNTIVTSMTASTEFLYAGDNPVQYNVDPDTIDERRTAILQGRILTKDGQPLPGVILTILNHPEFGQTVSRDDGKFDMVINGGGVMTVIYKKMGPGSKQGSRQHFS